MFIAKLTSEKFIFKDSRKKEKLMKLAEEKPYGLPVEIKPLLPESWNMRKFYFGGVLTLWAYLDGKDYRDSDVINDMHEVAKLEFNPKVIVVNGESRKIGQSSKKKLADGMIDRAIDYLEDQYGIDRTKVLNPDDHKYFLDAIFPTGNYETYIDYLVELRLLPGRQQKII